MNFLYNENKYFYAYNVIFFAIFLIIIIKFNIRFLYVYIEGFNIKLLVYIYVILDILILLALIAGLITTIVYIIIINTGDNDSPGILRTIYSYFGSILNVLKNTFYPDNNYSENDGL